MQRRGDRQLTRRPADRRGVAWTTRAGHAEGLGVAREQVLRTTRRSSTYHATRPE